MREVDRSAKLQRRTVLRGAAGAVPAAALAVAGGITPSAAWAADAANVSPQVMATLVKMSRDIYPHDHVADVFYVRAAQPWDKKAGTDPAFKTMLADGVARLDQDANDRFQSAYLGVNWEADRLILLRGIEQTKFFRTLRADLVVALYNQPEMWAKLGYEGSSAEYGGYLHRGFNDVDWLPSV